MSCKNKNLFKVASILLIGAFSFGLSISCVNAHKKETIKVSAEESDGTWTLSNGSLSFQYDDWQTNGYVTQTNQTMVYGHGDGTFDISYELLGSPPGATTAGTEYIAEKTIQLIDGYWTPSETGGYGTVSGYPVDVNPLDSGVMITLNIVVQYSGTMNEQDSGAGTTEPDGTWTLSNGNLSFQYTDWQTNGYVTQTNQTIVYGHGDGTFDISYELLGSPPGATTAGTEYIAGKTIQLTGGYWTPGDTGYGTVTGFPVDVNPLDSGTMITLNINVQYSGTMNEQDSGAETPEPPALSALEWYFDTDMGYFATNLYNDNYYSFSLSTEITSVIYDRENFTVIAHCTVTARDGNMPEEYYEAEMMFAYTFESSGLVENDYHFYNAVCEDTVEDKEEIYFSVDVVSFRQIGWYFDEDLRYYVEEGVEASWNILHAAYRTEGSRNELILYMQVLHDDVFFDDLIQINNPDFDEAPYRGQSTLGTGVNGWSDKLQQRISLDINYVPFGYYANGWSYDPYFNQLVYINADDIDMGYQLTSASSNEGSYLLTYTGGTDSQSITVTEAVYQDEMLTGEVVLVENSDPITVNVSVPQRIIDGGTTSTYEYHISFDGNGATSGTMSDDSFTSPDYSVDYELPECNFEREDYAFFAWSPSQDGMITIKPYETRNITYSEDGETFYAIWGRTITFNSNGGDGSMEPLVVKEGYNEVPSCGFTRDGYAFKCWAVGSPTGDEVNAGSRVYVNGNYVLYAVWETNTNNATIEIEEDEVVVYVGEEYLMQYKILPEGYEVSIFATVEQERIAEVFVEGEIFIYGLSAGTTKVTLSDESGSVAKTFTLYVVDPPEPVEPENKIDEQTIIEINTELADASLGLSSEQIEQISGFIESNKDYISDDAGSIVSQALGNTTIDSSKDYADAQKSLVVTVVETGLMVDAGKATSLSGAQEIDKALPSDVNFSVESEIDEFYQRQMVELFGGQMPSRRIVRAESSVREIDIDPKGREGAEAIEYLGNEETLYKKMVGFVDNSVDHMGKAALKIRKCSGESVVVQVKSYVTVVKVSSFRDFDKEAADKEFVEAAYKAILLSMQNEVISILEKEHEPSNNAEKEAQYQKELDAVKDYETFEIMVTEVLRQKYNTIAKEPIDDVDEFKPIYWEIFEAWALDKQSKYGITLEELTKATIEQSTNRARAFTVHSDLSTNEWVFIGAIAGGAALVITAAAVIPTLLKKKKAKEGIN